MGTASVHDRVALVTGAGTRIGKAIARALGEDGWRIAAHYFTSSVKETCAGLQDCRGFRADFRNRQELLNLVPEVIQEFGRLDLLVNNASVFLPTPVEGWPPDTVRELIDVNLIAPMELSVRALRQMKGQRGGRIINICDLLVEQPIKDHLAYISVRSSMWGLTRALAIEGASFGVSSHCIVLGTVLFGPQDKGREEAIISRIPAGQVPGPSPVVSVVRYLASAPSFITGTVIRVDGGRSLV